MPIVFMKAKTTGSRQRTQQAMCFWSISNSIRAVAKKITVARKQTGSNLQHQTEMVYHIFPKWYLLSSRKNMADFSCVISHIHDTRAHVYSFGRQDSPVAHRNR